MGDKLRGAGARTAVRIDDPRWLGAEAKRMSAELLNHELRKHGPGDTIQAAAYRLEREHRLDANIVLQGWQREPREMKVSRWMALFRVHWELIASKAAYEDKRNEAARTGVNPALLRLADTVAGHRAPAQPPEVDRTE